MPDLRSEPAPVSEAVTRDIRVEVLSQYSKENSRPQEDVWVFQYTVRITNQGQDTVQLISRHWIITDAYRQVEHVRGPGVVGEQPVLAPGGILSILVVVPAQDADWNHARHVSDDRSRRRRV